MSSSKTILLTAMVLAASAILSKTLYAAEAYPVRPIKIIVPTDPGGGSDAVARLVASELTDRFGKPVVVENRGGAGSVIGTDAVARAAPDGYTLLAINNTFSIQPTLEKLPYNPVKSFVPIANLGTAANCIVVHPNVPAKSVAELIALAKRKPGELLYASAGPGSTLHMSGELLKILTNTDFQIVQFRGSGPAMTDLIGGHTHFSINSVIATLPHIKSGYLRVLAVKGPRRSVLLPQVPTYEEAGLQGYDVPAFNGIIAPAGTPGPIVDTLSRAVKEIVASDRAKERLLRIGVEVDYADSSEFRSIIVNGIERWKAVVTKAGIKLN